MHSRLLPEQEQIDNNRIKQAKSPCSANNPRSNPTNKHPSTLGPSHISPNSNTHTHTHNMPNPPPFSVLPFPPRSAPVAFFATYEPYLHRPENPPLPDQKENGEASSKSESHFPPRARAGKHSALGDMCVRESNTVEVRRVGRLGWVGALIGDVFCLARTLPAFSYNGMEKLCGVRVSRGKGNF